MMNQYEGQKMTTHPILEAVAQAICCPRAECGARTGTSVCLWTTYKPNALAAILALSAQEPTQAIVKAANDALADERFRGGDGMAFAIKATLAQLAKEVGEGL